LSETMDLVDKVGGIEKTEKKVEKLFDLTEILKNKAIQYTKESEKDFAQFLYRESKEFNKPLIEDVNEKKRLGFQHPYDRILNEQLHLSNVRSMIEVLFHLQVRKDDKK
jgi:hypothetical protein